MTNIHIEFLYGLPASGKTTWANEQTSCYSSWRSNMSHILVDEIVKNKDKKVSADSLIVKKIFCHTHGNEHRVILDGLFVSPEEIINLIEKINFFNETLTCKYQIIYSLHWWKENREACLVNDAARNREKKSSITIKNLEFKSPHCDKLYRYIPQKRIHKHEVYVCPNYKQWAEKNEAPVDKDGKLTSQSWSLGGTYGSYNREGLGRVDPDPTPTAFKEFDDLLLKACPSIGFMQYKKLYNETVTTDERHESDYYGGSVTHAFYVCDLKLLYELMNEMNLVNTNE